MKALVKAEAGPGLWLRDVPEPEAHPGEVLVRVLWTGICGTDLHIRSWDAWAQSAVAPTPTTSSCSSTPWSRELSCSLPSSTACDPL